VGGAPLSRCEQGEGAGHPPPEILKRKKMDPKQFRELHARCSEALKRYVHEAERMCELFGQCLPEPLSLQILSEIIEQRVRENNAHASYFEIRRQLFEAVRIGYDPLN
jgi:hypothetical protein